MEHVRIPRCYGRLRKFRVGLLHIYLWQVVVSTVLLVVLALTAPLLFMAKMNFFLIMMVNFIAVFAINIWSIWLTLRFLRIISNISYPKIILVLCLQGLIVWAIEFGFYAMGLDKFLLM